MKSLFLHTKRNNESVLLVKYKMPNEWGCNLNSQTRLVEIELLF